MNVEIAWIILNNTLNKSQIEFDYYNQRDNCLDKLTMKTQLHVHDNMQTTRSLIIVRLLNTCSVTQGR